MLQLSKLTKFTSHKYGVSTYYEGNHKSFDCDSDRFLAMQHMGFLWHLVQNTTQLTSVKVQSVSFVQYNPVYLLHKHILHPRNILVVLPKSSFPLFKHCTSKIVPNNSQQYLCDNFIIFKRFTHNFKYYNQFQGLNSEVNTIEILKVNKIPFK